MRNYDNSRSSAVVISAARSLADQINGWRAQNDKGNADQREQARNMLRNSPESTRDAALADIEPVIRDARKVAAQNVRERIQEQRANLKRLLIAADATETLKYPISLLKQATLGDDVSQKLQLQLQGSGVMAVREAAQMAVRERNVPLAAACARIIENMSDRDQKTLCDPTKRDFWITDANGQKRPCSPKTLAQETVGAMHKQIIRNSLEAQEAVARADFELLRLDRIAATGEDLHDSTIAMENVRRGMYSKKIEADERAERERDARELRPTDEHRVQVAEAITSNVDAAPAEGERPALPTRPLADVPEMTRSANERIAAGLTARIAAKG